LRAPLSVVIPAYRESKRIGSTLEALVDKVDGTCAEIIVVDDGSDDDTVEVAEKALASVPTGKVLALEHNRGKGAAVRAGVLAASGEVVMYMDADLASDLDGLDALVAALEDADVAVGSRTFPGSRTIGGSRRRAVMARCFNLMARPVMRLPVRDTQCGFKAFRREAADRIFGLATIDRFAFDVEVLTLARGLGMTICEVPVTWRAVEGTRVRLVDPALMALDLVRIARRCRASRLQRAWVHPIGPMPEMRVDDESPGSVAIQG
jgi:glycosyltransferase involved in cell wall biosynthesis